MVEEVFQLATGEETTIKRVIFDENVHYLQMLFAQGDGLPAHRSNATVYMTVLKGRLTIALNGGEARVYEAPTLLKIPVDTGMDVRNRHPETLELIVVKAPAPGA